MDASKVSRNAVLSFYGLIFRMLYQMAETQTNLKHKGHIYLEYHCVCPFVRIGTPHPLSRKRVCPSPRTKGGIQSPAGRGVQIRTTAEKT
jgi:hypothetical protein